MGDWGDGGEIGGGGIVSFGVSIGSILIVGSSADDSPVRSPNEDLGAGVAGSDGVGAGTGGWIGFSGVGSDKRGSVGPVRSPKLVF